MSGGRDALRSLLEEKPGIEEQLAEVLAVDAERETWSFDDVPVDSGQFGELVSRGIVEKVDGECQKPAHDRYRRNPHR